MRRLLSWIRLDDSAGGLLIALPRSMCKTALVAEADPRIGAAEFVTVSSNLRLR
ncbi:hypothetical protein ES702_02347 [subsurface metagenome]